LITSDQQIHYHHFPKYMNLEALARVLRDTSTLSGQGRVDSVTCISALECRVDIQSFGAVGGGGDAPRARETGILMT
jgi:hypothetical protein